MLVEEYDDADEEYHIQGSYTQRCCKFYKSSRQNSSREPMAEIERKVDPTTHVMLGKDVFLLAVKPAFDCAFAMSLVLILDQMYGDRDVSDDGEDQHDVGTILEDSVP